MTEQEQRARVVTEAKTWLRTPFRHSARLRGIGADCETFICEVFAAAGVFSAQGIPYMPAQWFLNTREELYLNYLSKYAAEYVPRVTLASRPAVVATVSGATAGADVDVPTTAGLEAGATQPGDIICVRHRWVYSHGAIVIAWPKVIHCFPPCVMESSVRYNPVFAHRELKFFDPWGDTYHRGTETQRDQNAKS
jgi:cell wall-associated NlpC family hydrolase